MIFKNREEAAILLCKPLEKYKNSNGVVLAVPRGGVPVGCILADKLQLPLDVILAKKIGYPTNKEYAIGSVTTDHIIFENHPDVSPEYYKSESQRIQNELKLKYHLFKGGTKSVDLNGKIVILTDDGIATGNTLAICIESIKRKNPAKIIVAVPVAPGDTARRFRKLADEFICLVEADDFSGVGQFYRDFRQVDDDEVIELMDKMKSNY